MCKCAGRIARFLLFAINFGVWICGAVIMGVGIALAVDDTAWDWFANIGGDMSDGLFAAAVYTMIAVGCLLFLVGFLGCCGTCRNSKCMLQTYVIMVSILLVLELVGVILAFIFKDSLSEEIKNDMRDDLQKDYNGTNSTAGVDLAWNSMQTSLECCGSYNYTDYEGSVWAKGTGDPVPITCCLGVKEVAAGYYTITGTDKTTCMNEATNPGTNPLTQLHGKGCYDGLWDWIQDKSQIVIGVLLGLGAVQLFGVIVACCVKNNLDEDD